MDNSVPGFSVLHYLPEFSHIHVQWVSDAIQPFHLLLSLLLLLSTFPRITDFSNGSGLHIKWSKYWSLSFSISPSSEYSWLISFRIDWFDLLEVQGTLKSLIQQRSWKALVFWHTAIFMVQLSYLYMTIGKTIALTIWTFVNSDVSAF